MSDENLPKKRGPGRPKGSRNFKGVQKAGVFNQAKKRKVIELVEKNGGNYAAAAASVGVSAATINYHAKNDPVFKERLEMAKLKACEAVEEAITHRGIEGVDKDVYYQGNVVGQEKQYSDTLLMERARALMGDKYGKRSQVDISGTVTVEHRARSKLASLLGIELDIEDAEYEEIESGE
jgi:hypothetical protein